MSFIGDLLRRHPEARGRWPGEDLLTEATAAVLKQVEGLPGYLAGRISDRAPPEKADVSTQVSVEGRRRIDLEISAPGEVLLAIEVKDWAPESGDQLDHYHREVVKRAAEEGAEPFLVYLSRLGAELPRHPHARPLRWEDWGAYIRAWLRDRGEGVSPVERYLVEDYLSYLRERELMSTASLQAATLARLIPEFDQARQGLAQLHAMLDERVLARGWTAIEGAWARRAGGTRPETWPRQWWAAYQSQGGYPEHNDFDWLLWVPERGGEAIRIEAGLIWRRERGGPSPLQDASWHESLTRRDFDDGFGAFYPREEGQRLYRGLPLESLDRHETLGDQADHAAAFVTSTFALLREAGPGSG